ncbi:glycoside hydrolase superfamily [Abortiporus biennis]|nr:glycoside hydrolase superfamily [Abortiporus biennis]
MAYYPDWAADKFPPEKIDFSRVDWIDFAFAIPDENFNLSFDGSDNAPDLLNRLTTAAHNSGKKVKLSVGGWTGSKFFSPAVSTSANRQTLASNILDFYKQYNLDGIDIDWEYPGQQGDSANKVSTSDTANFLEFLKLLKSVLPEGAKITAATMTVPFANENGEPSDDVSAFADVLDWILIMNYDAWGSSSTPGANAPLNDGCKNSTQPSANALSAVQTWSNAGFPVSQIVLGVPSYGYISRSSATTLRSRSLSRRSPQYDTRPAYTFGHSLEGTSTVASTQSQDDSAVDENTYKGGIVIATNEDGGTDDGQVQFRQLVDQGVLKFRVPSSQAADGSSSEDDDSLLFADHLIKNYFTGFNDFARYWDQCSNTPFLRSTSARQVISYDDPQSLEMKARFAKEAGLKGINMFDIHGDTDDWDLIDGVRRGLGLNPVSDSSR